MDLLNCIFIEMFNKNNYFYCEPVVSNKKPFIIFLMLNLLYCLLNTGGLRF